MDLQRENDSELNLAEDSRKHQKKVKGMKSSTLQIEQQMSSVEIEFPNAFEDLQGKEKDQCTANLPSPPEKLIAGILGVIFFILMYIVIRVIVFIPSPATLKNYSSPIIKIQKAYSCTQCPLKWFTYSNNCYYISTENKTWTESLMACDSKHSSLVYIDNDEERRFLSLLSHTSWIGVFRRSSDHPWMLINGLISTLEIGEPSSGNGNCVVLQRDVLTSGSCESSKIYICKHRFYS